MQLQPAASKLSITFPFQFIYASTEYRSAFLLNRYTAHQGGRHIGDYGITHFAKNAV